MDLQKFVQLVQQNNGATFNLNTEQFNPNNGFMVSLRGFEEVIPVEEFHFEKVRSYAKKHLDLLLNIHQNDIFLGAWIDKGLVYLDVSRLIEDKRQAVKTGLLNQQLAIFDCSTKTVIELPTLQTAGTEAQKQAYLNQILDKLAPIKYNYGY